MRVCRSTGGLDTGVSRSELKLLCVRSCSTQLGAVAVVGGGEGGGGGRVGARTENSLLLSSFSVILESLCSRVRSKSES